MDPSPEIIAFDSCYEAQDFIAETIQGRVDYMVSHSPYSGSQSDLEGYEEQESQLVTITEESV